MARQLPRLVCQPPGWTSTLSTINDLFRASVVQTVGLADWVGLPNPRFLWLVVDVVGGGVQSFFLRVMVGTGIHTQPSASLHTPPVYIDYIKTV